MHFARKPVLLNGPGLGPSAAERKPWSLHNTIRNRQDRRAGTLRGRSITAMGFEPVTISSPLRPIRLSFELEEVGVDSALFGEEEKRTRGPHSCHRSGRKPQRIALGSAVSLENSHDSLYCTLRGPAMFHKRVVEACILDAQGKVVHRERFALNRQTLALFADRCPRPADPPWPWRPPPTAGRWPDVLRPARRACRLTLPRWHHGPCELVGLAGFGRFWPFFRSAARRACPSCAVRAGKGVVVVVVVFASAQRRA